MLGKLENYEVSYSPHALLKMDQRAITKELVGNCFSGKFPLRLARKNEERGNWELIFRKSGKYYLKIVAIEDGPNVLKVVTAYTMNRKKCEKAVKKWQKWPK